MRTTAAGSVDVVPGSNQIITIIFSGVLPHCLCISTWCRESGSKSESVTLSGETQTSYRQATQCGVNYGLSCGAFDLLVFMNLLQPANAANASCVQA